MNERQKIGALEAMLFANGEPVEAARLAEAMRIEPEQARELLGKLQNEYDERESGVVLLHLTVTAGSFPHARITARWSSVFWTPAAMHRCLRPHWKCWPSSLTTSRFPAALSSRCEGWIPPPPSPNCWNAAD